MIPAIRTETAVALAIAFGVAGCCNDKVDSRLFVGRLSPLQCRERLGKNPPPVTLTCPGDEVTLCWAASTGVKLDASDDSLGIDGPQASWGAITFAPSKSTSVTVIAGCVSVTRQVDVVGDSTQIGYDAAWDGGTCSGLRFDIDPDYVSPTVNAEWIRPDFKPVHQDAAGGPPTDCPTPPFLGGWKFPDLFGFELVKPFLTVPFSRLLHADGAWQFPWKACPQLCRSESRFPFAVGLTCRQP